MNRVAPSPHPSVAAPPAADPAPSAMPPLLPLWLTLMLAALALGLALAWLFPNRGPAAPAARFTDITEAAGVTFVHQPGAPTAPTTLGGAVIVLDCDGDGAPDLFLVNGAPWPGQEPLAKRLSGPTCALFRNDGHGHFTDITARAGLNVELQGMSAAAGDFDGDGLPDLFVACVGGNHLFHNRGDGRFEDVTEQAGVGGEENTWSIGAAWLDYDGDGQLDLVVAHYARWPRDVGLATAFSVATVGRSYGTPTGFLGAFPSVYRNLGGGRFGLVPGAAGLRDFDRQTGLPVAKTLAIVPVDANGDGRLDLLFSYHTGETALFVNQGDGTFRKAIERDARQEGAASGLAVASAPALAPAENTDARLAAFASARALEAPRAGETRLRLTTKLGVAPFDYDLDGRLEILAGNGLAEPDVGKIEDGEDFAAVPQLLFRSEGDRWVPAAPVGGWAEPGLVRGVAVADLDGDGDLDVVLTQHGGRPRILRNDQRSEWPWLRLQLVATHSHREAGGARVEIHTPRRVLVQTVAPAMAFMAQSESVLTFGLGEDARVRKIVVRWPSGRVQEVRPEGTNRVMTLREP